LKTRIREFEEAARENCAALTALEDEKKQSETEKDQLSQELAAKVAEGARLWRSWQALEVKRAETEAEVKAGEAYVAEFDRETPHGRGSA